MAKVNVGVIGLGIGQSHATNYQSCPDANLLAICDKDEAWLKHCQKEWNVPHAFTDAEELLGLSELQAVSITTPTFLHKPQTLAALGRGLHVLCEKPMAMNQAEGEEMVAAARSAGKCLMIGYNRRFFDDNRTMKKLIDDGMLGDVYFVRTVWQRRLFMPPPTATHRPTGAYDRTWALERNRSGGGALLDLGAHMLDLGWWLAGKPNFRDCLASMYAKFGPKFAESQGARWDIEDLAVGFLRFENGLSVELETSFASHVDAERVYIELYGSKGGLSTRSGKIMLYHEVNGIQTNSEIVQRTLSETTQGHFIRCILTSTPPDPSGEDGVAGLRMLDALYASAGEPIR